MEKLFALFDPNVVIVMVWKANILLQMFAMFFQYYYSSQCLQKSGCHFDNYLSVPVSKFDGKSSFIEFRKGPLNWELP